MPLTWRNVDAPDFRSSVDAYKSFSDLLGNAFGGLKAGIGEYDQALTNDASTRLMAQLVGAQTPEQAKAIAASVAASGGQHLDANALAFAAARPTALTQQANGEVVLDRSKLGLKNDNYTFDRTLDQNSRLDAAGPAVAALAAAAATGDPKLIAAANAKYAPQIAALPTDKILPTLQGTQSLESGAVNIAGGKLTNERTAVGILGDKIENQTKQLNYNIIKRTDEDNQVGTALAIKYMQGAANAADVRVAISNDPEFNKLTPGAKKAVLDGINSGGFGAVYAPSDVGLTGSIGGGTPSAQPWVTQVGGGTIPDNVNTIGEVIAYGKNQLIPSNRNSAALGLAGTGKGSSAVGAYQITGETLTQYAPKALGANWDKANFKDPVVQDKVARAIFEDNNKSAKSLMNRWASLSQSEAQALVGKSWDQARQVIASGETGPIDPAAVAGAARGNQIAISRKSTENQSSGAINILTDAALANSKETPLEVAQRLSKTKMPGATVNQIMTDMDYIRDKTKGRLSEAQIGEIAARGLKTGSSASLPNAYQNTKDWFKSWFVDTGARGNNLYTDRDKIDALIDQTTTNSGQKRVANQQDIQIGSAALDYAQQQFATADAALKKAVTDRDNGRPGLDVSRYVTARTNALRTFQLAQKATEKLGNFEKPASEDQKLLESLAKSRADMYKNMGKLMN